tara:strand:+ start:122 stop:283 length:162 start_codon:yes stop_codon:yes gene_type:complete
MIEHIIEIEVLDTGWWFSITGIEVIGMVVLIGLVGRCVYNHIKGIKDDDPSIP